ncbi:MAG: Crp/Fnr family transcriptional regulator [Eggerthellaceae bacterium]|nr:Crp/Fnr family transcriptional regulator [Eggerthellaceae bacterium]
MPTCSENAFCASLPEDARAKLCQGCSRQLLKAGSFRLYESFNREVSVIIDGVICGSQGFEESADGNVAADPQFALNFPGRPLSLDVTFFGRDLMAGMSQAYDNMVCLTDCYVATFSHDVFRELFESDARFARCVMQMTLLSAGDAICLSALLRGESVYQKVLLLMRRLLEFDLHLTRHDVANVLACNRTSVSRAFARVERERPELFARYMANKGRSVKCDMGRGQAGCVR